MSDQGETAAGVDTVVGDVTAAAAVASSRFKEGERIAGRYTIRRFLGRGGMGEVYEAQDEELHRPIAVKVLLAGRFDDERSAAQLRREIATARRVTHPNVCRVFDVKYHERIGLCTMELLDGESLADRVARRGALRVSEALPIVQQICAGLAAAHDAGIVHRDFKPHNVMLCGARAVITDFGLAIALEDPTRSLEVAGTPAYMAPEQLIGAELTAATDVYALGVTMFELLTGELPLSTRSQGGELDPRWNDVIGRCLARDPAARPSLAEIVPALSGASLRRRSRRLVVAGVGLVIAASAGVIALGLRGGGERPRADERFATGVLSRLIRLAGPGREKIESVTRDDAGNLYLVGHAGGGARLGGAALAAEGDALAIVTKVGADGRVRWSRTFTSTTRVSIAVVSIDRAGHVIVGGHSGRGTLHLGDRPRSTDGNANAFVVALSAGDGATRWQRVFTGAAETNVRAGAVGPDGNFYVTGEHSGGTDFGDGVIHDGAGPSPFVASYTPDGEVRWVVAGRRGDNTRGRVLVFDDGAVLAGGSIAGEAELGGVRWTAGLMREPYLISIDLRSGEPRWVRAFGGGGELWAIARTADRRLVVGGGYARPFEIAGETLQPPAANTWHPWVAEIDAATGAPISAIDPGAGDPLSWTVRTMLPLPDGRLLATGSRADDAYLATIDARGQMAVTARFEGPGSERIKGLALVSPGVLAIWGCHDGLTLGATEIPSEGLQDGFYAELRLDELLR